MSFIERLKETFLSNLAKSLVLGFFVVISLTYSFLEESLIPYVKEAPEIWILRLLIFPYVVLLLLCLFWLIQRQGELFFDDDTGTFTDGSGTDRYCASCYLKDDRLSPLEAVSVGWRCRVSECNSIYNSKEYKERIRNNPRPGRRVISKGR